MSMFYSKSKDPKLKYLSNFENIKIEYKGRKYNSVEHGFQAMKYIISERDDIGKLFEIGGKYSELSCKEVKKIGSRIGFKNNGCTLDNLLWNIKRVEVMEDLIKARYLTDEKFRNIISKYDNLLHFERSGKKSFWGGSWNRGDERIPDNFKGNNMLGKIIIKIKKENDQTSEGS